MSEVKRILDMIADGTISSEEGMALIDAIKDTDKKDQEEELVTPVVKTPSANKKSYSFLKVRVETDEDDTKVNVNVPLKLVKSLGGLTKNIGNYIPEDARETMNEHGVNIESFDIDEIISALEDGSIDGPLVDIDTEEDGKKTKVKVYVE